MINIQNSSQDNLATFATAEAPRLNINKIQAAFCMATSATVSISLIYWAVGALS